MLTSIAILLFSSLPIYYLVSLLFSKLNSSNAIVGIMFLSFVISSIVIWYVDMELPLNQTHIRNTNKALSVYWAVVAWQAKLSFLACCICGSQTLKRLGNNA